LTLEGAEEVNHLWQVGPEVNKDGIILEHALNPENKYPTRKLKLKGAKASSWLTMVSYLFFVFVIVFLKIGVFFLHVLEFGQVRQV
jgi:hypothetical protein